MSKETSILLIVIVLGFVIIFYSLKKWLEKLGEDQKPSGDLLEWLKSTGLRLDEQNKVFTSALQTSTRALNERLDKAAMVIAQVQRNIGEMSEIGRGMKDLQEFLRSPKLRGNVGEQVLKELLGQMLPKQSFHLQYSFKSGVIVDAAVKTSSGIIPIDSKFPMDNFRKMMAAKDDKEKKSLEKEFIKEVKGHIDAIARKYILTEEGTLDYALMYLPSEAVYYEVVNNPSLFDYSSKKRVLPVSPMTFYAYLKAILMSFEGQKIEARAKQILRSIRAIQKDYLKLEENLNTLGRHITNAYNQMGNVSTGFSILGQKITSTEVLEQGPEVKELPDET